MHTLLPRWRNCRGLRIPLPGRWQVEVWWCPAGADITDHAHRQSDGRLVFLAGRMVWRIGSRSRWLGWPDIGWSHRIPAGTVHGATVNGRFGLFLNIERWLTDAKTSAATDFHAHA